MHERKHIALAVQKKPVITRLKTIQKLVPLESVDGLVGVSN